MKINVDETPVVLRKVTPPEGMVIHNKVEDTYLFEPDGKASVLYLAKEEDENNYEYVWIKDVPEDAIPKPPEEVAEPEVEAE